MSIEELIKSTAERFEGSFIFDDWQTADLELERKELPVIIAVLPTTGKITFDSVGQAHKEKFLALSFLDKVPRDATGEENAEVYTRMEDKALQFVASLNASGAIEPIESVEYTHVYEAMSDVVSGVMLSLVIKSKGICV